MTQRTRTAPGRTERPVTRRYPWWRVHPWLAGVAVLVVVAGIAWGVRVIWPQSVQPVYVTDGAHIFSENLRAVEDLILKENQRVVGSGLPYVSIAIAENMNLQPDDETTPDVVRHSVQGAHIAQVTWNRPAGDPPDVLVTLLLADQGSRGRNWSATSDALGERVKGPDRLVAVTGLGVSVDTTTNMINALSARKIAIVSAALTADKMTVARDGNGPVSGMVRVSPTNSDEARAAVKFLDGTPMIPDRANIMLVQDQDVGDEYAASLGTAFTTALTAGTARNHVLVKPTMTYDSRLDQAGMILGASADRVCTANADIVYFAGREADLRGFLGGLATRSCAGRRHLTVVSGDAVAHLANKNLWEGTDANMTVVFTSLAHPDIWARNPPATTTTRAQRFGLCDTCFRGVFSDEPPEALVDNGAIMDHDAVWTAIKAVEFTRNTAPSASAVAQALTQLRVDLASGWICSFDADHNPVDKAIPIIRIDQNGKLHYLTLSSPSGLPPSECPS